MRLAKQNRIATARFPRAAPWILFILWLLASTAYAAPLISIKDAKVQEGNIGIRLAAFTVKLSAASTNTVTLSYSTSDDTAEAGTDYDAASGLLTFNPGTTSQTININIIGDALDENDETFFVLLSGADNAIISDAQGKGTIRDDDPLPGIAISDAAIAEGDLGTNTLTFTVTLLAPSSKIVTVNYATAKGKAVPGQDFQAVSGIILFDPGQTIATIDVPVLGDLTWETNETFSVKLSRPVNARLSDSLGVATITNDDPQPTISIADVTLTEGTATTANLDITLSNPSGAIVKVRYTTASGTATPTKDYRSGSGLVTFRPGETSKTISVPIPNDALNETAETFFVNLTQPAGASILEDDALVTILNDDPLPSLRVKEVFFRENLTVTVYYNFEVKLSEASGQPITVDYQFFDGTATLGADYQAQNGTLAIPPGATFGDISVTMLDDDTDEPNETFFVNLSNPTNATLSDFQAYGLIVDDDPTYAINISANLQLTEGNQTSTNITVNVGISPAHPTKEVRVDYSTANGTALAGSDYVAASGTLIFPAGVTNQPITITLIGDSILEPTELFYVNLSNATNATIFSGQLTIAIVDDEPLPQISISDASVLETDAGSNFAVFSVTLSFPIDLEATVNFTTANGTATAGTDYVATAGTLTFPAGSIEQALIVELLGDTVTELDETFYVNLSSPTLATIADGQGLGTILNNEPVPAITIDDVTVTEGNSGTLNAVFNLHLSFPLPDQTVRLNYATADGTAVASADYITKSGTVSFAPGSTNATLTVAVKGETIFEADEFFFVNLSNPAFGTLANNQAIGTIHDNDVAPSIFITDATAREGGQGETTNATFNVFLSQVAGQTVTVNYATSDGTAISTGGQGNRDYEAASGTVTFPAGTTNATINVTVYGKNGNNDQGADEYFFVNLSNPFNGTIIRTPATGTILNDDPTFGYERPSLSINDISVSEGNSGTRNAVFTVTLANPRTTTVTVNYSTADLSAIAGADYVAASGTLTFPSGATTQTITVLVNSDLINEASEAFIVVLDDANNAVISDNYGICTITNDDPTPTATINDVTVTEGNSGTTNALFTVTLSTPLDSAVTINYATSDGTAAGGIDYASASGTLTFPPGTTTQTITVVVSGDSLDEINETFFVNLTNPSAITLADSLGIGTIQNDDGAVLSIGDRTVAEGNSGSTNATFTVTLSNLSSQTVTVSYSTANSSATAGSDYLAASGPLTFPPGTTNQTISVTVNGDTLNELDETFLVNLTNPSNATIADSQAIGTIQNDDAQPAISIADVSLNEGNSGSTNATFTVSLSAASGLTVSVDYATQAGSATAGLDFITASGTLIFPAGDTSQNVIVTVSGDTLNELDETFFVNLTNPVNATLADNQALGTILNDDPLPSLSVSDVTVAEGNSGTTNALFTITLSPASGRTVTVDFATTNNTATAGSDYVTHSGSVSFMPGVTTQTITVTVNGDTIHELTESFLLNLTNPVNANIADSQGTATITNDDAIPTLSISDVALNEGNSGTTNAVFTVSLSSASGLTVTVNFATANDTATAGSDYATNSGILTFTPGITSQTITVVVTGDTANEQNENFFVVLSSPSNATLADSTGAGTIINDDGSVLSINDVTVSEGNSATVTATFTVSIPSPNTQTITVNYSTANLTATAGNDYVAVTSGTVTIPAGNTSQTISITINGDTLNEANETFAVNLTNPTNATIGDAQGIGTIENDDPLPSLSIDDVSVTEGTAVTNTALFTVTLSAASAQTVTVNFATSDLTAVAGNDYTAASGTLTFSAGVTTRTITIISLSDTTYEPDETFLVSLSNPSNAVIFDSQGTGTIVNDDAAPTLAINDIAVTEGNSGTTNALFSVTLSNPNSQTVTVTYTTTNATATAGNDYVAQSGTLTFPPGNTNQTITVPVNGDVLWENNETFLVNLTNPSQATIADSQGIGTIVNDDALPAITITDVPVLEGNAGTVTATFTVNLSSASSMPVTVDYATADNTASAGSDYVTALGTLTFPSGNTSQTLSVTVNGDTLHEANEIYFVNLSNASNASIADSQALGTISNDDPVPTLTINDVTVTEGNSGTTTATFTVTLSAASGSTVTANYTTANGTATAGSDYTTASGTLTFTSGTTTQTIAVTVTGDTVYEDNETFFVNLSNANNADLADSQGLGTISNDEAAPILSINDVSINEGNSGTVSALFTVTLSSASFQTVSVNYATSNNTATAGSDYTSASGTVTFPAGTTTQNIAVQILSDTTFESSESFFVNLSVPTNASLADGQGLGTITNDDTIPTLSINDVEVAEGDSGTTNAVFTVTLSAASSLTVTVNYSTANGTAQSSSDYSSASGTLTFTAGTTTQTVTVVVKGNDSRENNETFFVNLSAANNATISDSQGLGTILNDDGRFITISDVSVSEGNSGTTNAVFTLTLSQSASQSVTVEYFTSAVTATANTDYVSTNGIINFPSGITTRTVTVLVNGDTTVEPNETFLLVLTNSSNASIFDSRGQGTILNDDSGGQALPGDSPPRLAIQAGQNGAPQLHLTGLPGTQYIIETSSDLNSWTELGILSLETPSAVFLDPDPAPPPHRFYRARSTSENDR